MLIQANPSEQQSKAKTTDLQTNHSKQLSHYLAFVY